MKFVRLKEEYRGECMYCIEVIKKSILIYFYISDSCAINDNKMKI
jgi:hypothetical protein